MKRTWVPLGFVAVVAGSLALAGPAGARRGRGPAMAQNAVDLGRVFSAHFVDRDKGWALADLVAGEPRINVVKTTDGGNTWQILWTFVREVDLEGIWMTSDSNGVVSAANRYFRTTNGGRTWGRQRTPYEMSKMSFAGGHGFAIGMPPVKHGTEGPTLLRTTNGGGNWAAVVDQPATVADYCFSTEERGWIADGAGLSVTTDGGGTWTQKKPAEGLTAVACHGGRYAWGAGGGKVLQTFDGGAHWFEHDLGTSAQVTHLVFVDGSIGWAYGERDFRKTVDGGLHWTVLNTPPGPPRFFDGESGWALDSNGDIHRTSNGGRSWARQPRSTNARTDSAVEMGADGAEAIPEE